MTPIRPDNQEDHSIYLPPQTEGNLFFSRGTWLAQSLLDFTFFFAPAQQTDRMTLV